VAGTVIHEGKLGGMWQQKLQC